MSKVTIFVLSVFILCSCSNEYQHKGNSLTHKSGGAMIMASSKSESKNLLISYNSDLKNKIKDDINKLGANVVYEMKNINVLVVSVPNKMIDKYIIYFRTIDGVYGVQEDNRMYLN